MPSTKANFRLLTFIGVMIFCVMLAACDENSSKTTAADDGSKITKSESEETTKRVPLSVDDDINVDVIAVQYATHWEYEGTIAFNIGTGKRRLPDPETEDFIVVIREETATVPSIASLERGFAYQWLGKGKFHKISQVDLSMSDEEISKLFGVGKPSNEQLLTEMLKGRETDLEEATRLLKAVRNVNYRGPSGRGIIHQGSYWGHFEILKMLIEKGANPNLRGMNEGTPLISAAAGGNPEIVEYLISLGADIHLVGSYGEGALHYAMYNDGCLECAKILIAHGADPTLKSKDGKTPLELAKSNKGTMKNYDEMITYLSSL